jgi:N-formylglutamate deformylase
MFQSLWTLKKGNSPLVATAIHNGHAVRPEVAHLFALDEMERLYEEDPFTGQWVTVADTQIVVHCSRFEVDLGLAGVAKKTSSRSCGPFSGPI